MTVLREHSEAIFESVDRTAGVIRGVRVLGSKSRNNRRYSDRAISEAAKFYDGKKVYLNHATEGKSPTRRFQDFVGELRNVREGKGEVRADLHVLTEHASSSSLLEAAEKFPKSFGLSHSAEGETKRVGTENVVEHVTAVHSVDIVADPATNAGLFEEKQVTFKEGCESLPEVLRLPMAKLVEAQGYSDMPMDGEQGDADPQTAQYVSGLLMKMWSDSKTGEEFAEKAQSLYKLIKSNGQDAESEDEGEPEGEPAEKKFPPKDKTKESLDMTKEETTALLNEALAPLKTEVETLKEGRTVDALKIKVLEAGLTPTAEILESLKSKDAAGQDAEIKRLTEGTSAKPPVKSAAPAVGEIKYEGRLAKRAS